ncbi:MAG: sulfatase-like hydrolase/transferase [Candidatus Micrarchaeaceae archaeon]
MIRMRNGRPDIIFLMLDTVRADALGVYGGPAHTSTISALAKSGTVYERVVAPGTYTVPSHASLFTGKRVKEIKGLTKDPIKHSEENIDPFLTRIKYITAVDMTLAEKLGYLGYNTALISNNPFLSVSTGLGKGFAYAENLWFENSIDRSGYVKRVLKIIDNEKLRKSLESVAYGISRMLPRKALDKVYINIREKTNKSFSKRYGFYSLDKGAATTNKRIISILKKAGHPNFIFANYMEGHEGYPTNLISNEYVEQEKWLYLSGIASKDGINIIQKAYLKRIEYLDSAIGALLRKLRENGGLDNAIVIIASDHGQAFMEHGLLYHNMFPYEELVHVPLIVARFVNGKQINTRENVNKFVSLTALNESIMKVARGETDIINGSLRSDNFVISDHVGLTEVWDISMLRRLMRRSEYARRIYLTKLYHNTFATAVYYKNFKLIHYFNNSIKDVMFDIIEDPYEKSNIINEKRQLAHQMAHVAIG